MRIPGFVLFTLILTASVSCRKPPDHESLRAEILEMHRDFIQAHLDKDADFIARPTAPDYLSVSEGIVRNIDASEMRQSLSEYLDSTEFSAYSDVAEPIIGFSRDGSLAWSIVRVRVAGQRTRLDGAAQDFDTLWAWLTLYRRNGAQWMRIADVSTNRPFDESS